MVFLWPNERGGLRESVKIRESIEIFRIGPTVPVPCSRYRHVSMSSVLSTVSFLGSPDRTSFDHALGSSDIVGLTGAPFREYELTHEF